MTPFKKMNPLAVRIVKSSKKLKLSDAGENILQHMLNGETRIVCGTRSWKLWCDPAYEWIIVQRKTIDLLLALKYIEAQGKFAFVLTTLGENVAMESMEPDAP